MRKGCPMSGFTKLVPEIVNSSIWNESPEVRCVWIALIATKDKDGNVRGNPRSLTRLANIPVERAQEALEIFQAPDPDSNNPEQEGRRIEAIPGGWHIVSHAIYRAKDYREHEAERKKAYRERKQMSGTCPGQVPDSSVSVSASESDSEGESKGGDAKPPKPPDPPLPPSESFKHKAFTRWTLDEFGEAVNAVHMAHDIVTTEEGEKFVRYWSEPSANGKMRFQLQKTWSTAGRMRTWRDRAKERKP